MTEGQKYLVVVSILEGQNFPRRQNRQLSIEARFDGEHLATDPVEHAESPDINQELAWELDKKSLHQHRLQRSPIKLLCYAIEKGGSNAKEEVGYVVLDLRSALGKQPPKWYPLLHTKYSKLKPELRLCIYAEKDKGTDAQQAEAPHQALGGGAGDASSGGGSLLRTKRLDVSQLRPVFNDSDGWYELGPQDGGAQVFVLAVTIVSARNLLQLVPSTASGITMCADTEGFYFFYTFFGNDILTQNFLDIVKPSFTAERASVRVRCHADVLQLYVESQPPLKLNLCSGDNLLASCDVPLNQLGKGRSMATSASSIECTLTLQPSPKIKDQLTALSEDNPPTVCVTLAARLEECVSVPIHSRAHTELVAAASVVGERPPRTAEPSSRSAQSPNKAVDTREEAGRAASGRHAAASGGSASAAAAAAASVAATGASDTSYSSHFTDAAEDAAAHSDREGAGSLGQGSAADGSHGHGSDPAAGSSLASALTTTSEHTAIPPQPRHFRWSVHLENVSRVEVTNQARQVYIRYSYPYFGSAAPVMTHPAVEVRKGATVRLPQSFCAFHFSMTAQQLRDILTTYPLKLEIWELDTTAGNRPIGTGTVPLQCLLSAVGRKVKTADGQEGIQYTSSGTLKMLCDERRKAVAQLQYSLTLDDLGVVPVQLIVESEKPLPSTSGTDGLAMRPRGPASTSAEVLSPVTRAAAASAADVPVRDSAEYRTALELEMWKAAQEEAFEKQLQEKEKRHLSALAEEWKQRDLEREMLTKKKLAEYSRLEQQVQTLLADVAKRDRELSTKEQDLERQRSDMLHDYECKTIELKEISRRLELDYEHKLELSKLKYAELEGQLARAKQEIQDVERKYQALDREFSAYKEQQHGKPEVRLQSEISMLTLEKVELERKLEAANKSKLQYKQQWGRALKELARLKEQEQAEARNELRRRQQELEHMRLRYLAAEEGDVIKSDRRQLDDVKSELQRLKEIEEEKLKMQKKLSAAGDGAQPSGTADQQTPSRKDGAAAPGSLVEDAMEERVARLIEERDTLLRTGVYSSSDRIIVELDRQIRDAISRHNAAAMAASGASTSGRVGRT